MIHPLLSSHTVLPDASHEGLPAGRSAWITRIPPWLALAVALLPVISWFLKRLDDGGDEPLGLLPLTLAVVLAWRDRKSLPASAAARTTGALAVMASVLTIDLLPPMIRAVIAVIGIGAWTGMHRRAGLLGLLVLSLPVVASLQFYAGYPMRVAAAEGAVRILELGGIVVKRNGVGIALGGMNISVDPACSGIRMLWHALAAAMALAAIHRSSWRVTLASGLFALFLTIPANAARAAWLALEESGRVHGSGLSHTNIGLVCFAIMLAPLWIFISRHAGPSSAAANSFPPTQVQRAILLAAAVLATGFAIRGHAHPQPTPPPQVPAAFTFNGLTLPLHPLPTSPEERAFAESFPGTLSSHRWGDGQVILRTVTSATRRLHPSRDCLHAAGYETTDSVTVQCADGSTWSRFTATRDAERLTVHERIVSAQDQRSWTDVTAWYWSALWHPLNGPWRAETLISR